MKTKYPVLVADDDAAMLKITVRALEQHGYSCETAPDAYQAVQLLMTKKYDLLVSDLEMPGNENLCLIRNVPEIAAGLPVILMTGFPTVETAVQSIQLPVAAYLTKPFKIEVLIQEADKAVRRFQAFRTVCNSQERSQKWCQDLASIRATLTGVKSVDASPWENLLDLTLQNIAASLQDVRVYADAMTTQKNAEGPAPTTAANGPLILLNAVQETISVLEKTKTAFKSRELGNLRKRLESLVPSGTGMQSQSN